MKYEPNRKQKNAGRARTRYLTNEGYILKGTELFIPRTTRIMVMAIDPHRLEKLRSLTLAERKKHFDPKKSWTPAALGAPDAITDLTATEEQENERHQAGTEDGNQDAEGRAEPSGEGTSSVGDGEAVEAGEATRADSYDLPGDGLDHDGGESPG